MNYRHIYHAGNFADVVKHLVLVLVLSCLKKKEAPFFVLDTHGGIGLYDLKAEAAQKTGEAAGGIGALQAHCDFSEHIKDYIKIVKQVNGSKKTFRKYPGSPMLVRESLRAQDRFVTCELHPEDFQSLKRNLGRDSRVRVEHRDGYEAVRALLPPSERRGVILIDPPFEEPDEFSRMVRALREGHRRFSSGVFLLWHPIKDLAPVRAFYEDIKTLGIPDILAVSLFLRAPEDPALLNGSGLVIVNPPWQLEETLGALLPDLALILTGEQGFATVERIAEEKGGAGIS